MALRIVFMGTPDFAVPALTAIYEAGHEIVGVITSTDKFGGRGRKTLIQSAVKKEAVRLGLPILQPPRLKNKVFIIELKKLNADIQFVVAFRMLPEIVWNMPRLGTYNIHGSLLPKYRGAAPIHWAVINGEKETGVTSFKLKHEIDTGSILSQKSMSIEPNDTTGDVYNRMKYLGAQLATESLDLIESGDYELKEQDASKISKAPKIFHETCQIDFNQRSRTIHNFVRGLNPYPLAWTAVGNLEVKLLRVSILDHSTLLNTGEWVSDNQSYIYIGTSDGGVQVDEIKVSGKRAMSIVDFLNGHDLTAWQNKIPLTIVSKRPS